MEKIFLPRAPGAAALFDPLLLPVAGAAAQPSSDEILEQAREEHKEGWVPARAPYVPSQQELEQFEVTPEDQEPVAEIEELQAPAMDQVEQPIEDQDNRSDDEAMDIQPLLQRIDAIEVPAEIPQAEASRYRQFIDRLKRFISENSTYDNAVRTNQVLSNMLVAYEFYKERNTMGAYKEPQQDRTAETNKQWMDEIEQRPLPSQCRRRIYADPNGVLRSVVICDSLNDQRVYHDY